MKKLYQQFASAHAKRRVRVFKNRSGQAAVEFIAVAVVLFFFLLFLMSTAFLLVISDYIDYATFMAARTLKSGFSRAETQQENARLVFDQYISKIEGLARNFRLDFVRSDPGSQATEGVVVSYDIDLFYLPPLFVTDGAPASRITLTSESHLGRDPSFEECMQYFQNYANEVGITDPVVIEQLEDNGC
jgi:hypothetical protein